MATVSFSITRDSGIVLTAHAEVGDSEVADMASMIGAMVFDASIG